MPKTLKKKKVYTPWWIVLLFATTRGMVSQGTRRYQAWKICGIHKILYWHWNNSKEIAIFDKCLEYCDFFLDHSTLNEQNKAKKRSNIEKIKTRTKLLHIFRSPYVFVWGRISKVKTSVILRYSDSSYCVTKDHDSNNLVIFCAASLSTHSEKNIYFTGFFTLA